MQISTHFTWTVIFITALLIFASRAADFNFPPDNDQANYLLEARQIANGHGLTTPVIWHHLRPEARINGPGNDYWMPLTSLIMAPAMLVSPSYQSAILMSVLWSSLLIVFCFILFSRLTNNQWLSFIGILAICFHPHVRYFGSTGDSSTLFICFLLATILQWDNLHNKEKATTAISVGLLAGLCVLTRSEGLIILPMTMLLAVTYRRLQKSPGLSTSSLIWSLAGMALILVPWSLRNWLCFGTLWNPAAGFAPFMLSYLEIYEFFGQPSFNKFLHYFISNPGIIVASKFHAATDAFMQLFLLFSPFATPLIALGIFHSFKKSSNVTPFLLFYLLSLIFVYGFLVNAIGLNTRVLISSTPILMAFALTGVQWLLEIIRKSFPSIVLSKQTTTLISLAVCSIIIFQGERLHTRVQPSIEPRLYLYLDNALKQLNYPSDKPILTLQPWQLNWATGRPAISIPSDGIQATIELSKLHDAHYLLVTDYFTLFLEEYSDFLALWRNEVKHPSFQLVYSIGYWRLFRIIHADNPAPPNNVKQ